MSNRYITLDTNFYAQSGFAFPSTAFVDSGIPVVRMSDLKDGQLKFTNTKYVSEFWLNLANEYLLKENDFLLGMSGSLSNYALVSKDKIPALLNQRVSRLKSKNDNHSYEYVTYWLKSNFYQHYAEIQGEGAAQKNISSKQIGLFKYRDAPREEQKAIVSVLKVVERSIEKTEALIEKYQQIKAGLMHDLFTRGIGADGKLRPPREEAPELYRETPIGWIPLDWKYNTLKQIFGSGNIINGPFGSDLLTSELKNEGTPVLYCQDIKVGAFTRISKSHVSEYKALQLAFCNVRKYDILLAKVGSPPCDSCIYDDDVKAIVTQDVIRIRPSNEHCAEYFSSWFNSSYGRKSIKKISIEGTRERVSLGEFKNLLLPFPDILEQNAIGQRLNKTQRLISLEKENLLKLNKQKAGLMRDLLTGKVQVHINNVEEVHV